MGRLQAENSPIPIGIMAEADVFDLEVILPPFPLRHPGQMHLIEVPTKLEKFGLTKSGNFDLIGARKNSLQHAIRLHRQINANLIPLELATDERSGKAAECLS